MGEQRKEKRRRSCENVGGSKQTPWTYADLREEYTRGADELLGNPDPHFMHIDPVIQNSKRKQQQNTTFQRQ